MTQTFEDRAIVVGGGPVGLITALDLVQRGVPVLVLEAETTPIQDPRGAAFHPPTLEVLERLGVLDDLMAIGLKIPLWQVRNRDGSIVAEFDLGVLKDHTAYPYRFHLGQQKVVPVLLAALAKQPMAEVRFGHRVTGFEEQADGVIVHYTDDVGAASELTGRWLIGADGARSQVRKASGIAFEGFTWPERFVVTNLADDLEKYGFAYTNYVTDPDRWAVVLRLEDEAGEPNWRVTYPTDPALSDEEVLDPASVQERLVDVISGAEKLTVRYSGICRVHQRVAAEFRRGRVMLVGDAAHINNPLGGFGLNSGVQDAANLAAKLADVWHGRSDDTVLDRYDRQRRTSNIEFVQKASIRNKKMIDERDPEVRRRSQEELGAIAGSPERALSHLLESSMINSVRAAAEIE
ncbi:FAD-dependent oxidoreductase [Sphingobium sp. B2]|uniref:FAD-dependent oxidoreductase n=1 Tax=Sphingobium sp. B2 TaxID=2583228 RepID=UPI0011A46F6B|nr:FAD-dependent monooxygenase [Sphingobium sp. B2]